MLKIILLLLACLEGLSHASTHNEINVSLNDNKAIPNDPLFSEQWGLYNPEYGHDIGALHAWQIERGILGLIKSHKPSMSWAQLKHAIIANTTMLPFEEDRNKYVSQGYCNAFNALQ